MSNGMKSPGFMKLKQPNEKDVVKKMMFFFVFVVALIMVLFMSNVPFLSKQQVEARLGGIADKLAAYAKETGSEAKLSYGDVSIVGTAYEKKALVKNFSLSVSHTAWLGGDTLNFTTPSVLFVPDVTGSSQFAMEFPEPVSVAMNGSVLYTVSFPEGAPKYFSIPQKDGGNTAIKHILQLPQKLVLNTPYGAKESALNISYDPNPKLICYHTLNTNKSNTEVAFQNVVINGPKNNINIGSFNSQMQHQPAAGGKLAFDANIVLNDVGVKGDHGMEGPYSFRLSANGTRIAPTSGTMPPPDTDVTLRELSISADKFHLGATGNLSRKSDDPLAFGMAEVKVENFSSLRNSANLSPEMKAALVDAASHISGTDASTADNFNFTVKREKLGQLAVGNTSMAELTTAFLSHIMLGGAPRQDAAAPAPEGQQPNAAAAPVPLEEKLKPASGGEQQPPKPAEKKAQ